jgi:hypothetical protein
MEIKFNASGLVSYDADEFCSQMKQGNRWNGKYLLKDGSVVDHPVYGKESGIFVTDDLVLELRFSAKEMTAKEAQTFYDLEGLVPPTLYQMFLLCLNQDKVNRFLLNVGMSQYGIPAGALKKVWFDVDINEKLNSDEKRRVLVFKSLKGFKPLPCVHIDSMDHEREFLLIDNAFLVMLEESFVTSGEILVDFDYFTLMLRYGSFDILQDDSHRIYWRSVKTGKVSFPFKAKSKDYEFLSDELFVVNSDVYQIKDEKFIHVHSLCMNAWMSSADFDGKYLIISGNEAMSKMDPYEPFTDKYDKDEEGFYRKLVSQEKC